MRDASSDTIIAVINSIPNALEPEDVTDLFTIVQDHYVSRTPSVKVRSLLGAIYYNELFTSWRHLL